MLLNRIKYYLPFFLGLFVVLTTIVFIILGGCAFFYDLNNYKSRVSLHNIFNNAFYLIYFTIQTNLFLGCMLVIYFFQKRSILINSLFFSSVVLITITFIIYWIAIAPFNDVYTWKNIYLNFDSIITHVVNPFIGFLYFISIRKKITINKKYVGILAIYLSIFLIINCVLYAVTARVNDDGVVEGTYIYAFINIRKILFLNLESIPILGWIIYLLLIAFCPFLAIGISQFWIKLTQVKTTTNSYYNWMNKIKK